MDELPKKFPELSIMYKTLSKRIRELENEKIDSDMKKRAEIELKINKYHIEKEKIKSMFPQNFFGKE